MFNIDPPKSKTLSNLLLHVYVQKYTSQQIKFFSTAAGLLERCKGHTSWIVQDNYWIVQIISQKLYFRPLLHQMLAD